MYVDLVMKENEATLEKSGWSLSMYVRAYVKNDFTPKFKPKRAMFSLMDFGFLKLLIHKEIY